jgi:hypothetical protein
MLLNVQVDQTLVRKRGLKNVPIIQALLDMTPSEIEVEVRSRISNQADAITMIVHLTKLVALLLQLENERRNG